MAYPLRKRTLFTAVCVTLILATAFPLYPVVAASFEAGLLVGLLLHSAHISENIECENTDQKA
jgi:ABC-type maltose transport system permease subunit